MKEMFSSIKFEEDDCKQSESDDGDEASSASDLGAANDDLSNE